MIKLLMLLLLALPLQATPLPKALAVPGGIVEIELGSTHQSKPRAFFQQRRVLITAHDDRWLAVVGLPLSLKPGKHTLTVFTLLTIQAPTSHLPFMTKPIRNSA